MAFNHEAASKMTVLIEKLFGKQTFGISSGGFGLKIPSKLKPYDYLLEYRRQIESQKLVSKGKVATEFLRIIERALENSEVVEVDKRLVSMIEQTEDEIFYRPLFFDTIFLNTDFHVGDYILKGIILMDGMEYAVKKEDWFMISSAIHKDGHGLFLFTQLLDEPFKEYYKDFNKEILEVHKHIRNMACTFVDLVMMNDTDLDVVTIKPTKHQQEKRERNGRLKIPTKIYIRPKKHFIKYLDDYNKADSKPMSHRFRVRGFIRHYRDERYTDKRRQKPQFIKPYYKGQGILVQKRPYKVMSQKGEKNANNNL